MPAVGALGEGLRWPGKEIEIKQMAGILTLASGGRTRVYEPTDAAKRPKHQRSADDGRGRDRDMPARGRGDALPIACGWEDKTLVVQAGDPDDDHPPFEERYSVSEDGERLIEVVGFHGGRSAGFTMSRVWDRVPPPLPK
jgi:hypothetical protein